MVRELDSTEEKIVSATFNIVQSEGVTKATTKRIAKDAGVNEVTVFRKFENKKNLIEITKEYYLEKMISMLEEIFSFEEGESIESYQERTFRGMVELPDTEFKILRVAMQDINDISGKKLLITQIIDSILNKIDAFYTMHIEKGTIREVNAKSLGLMCFSMTFQSIVLWKVYNATPDEKTQNLVDGFYDILYNGIKK